MIQNRRPRFFFSLPTVVGILAILTIAFGQQRSLAYQQPTPHKAGAAAGTLNPRTPNTTNQGVKGANETYTVVAIGNDIEVKSKSEMKNLQKQLDQEYKQDTKKYQDAKKDKKNPDANSLKKPDKKDYTAKTLKANFKTHEEAQKFADEKIREHEKSGVKKTTSNNNNW